MIECSCPVFLFFVLKRPCSRRLCTILFVDRDGRFDFDVLCEELYYTRLDAVHDNFRRIHDYHCAEDWICRTYRDEFGF